MKNTELAVENHQALSIHATPDSRILHQEESSSCANEETCTGSMLKGQKQRHFAINGDICVTESVVYKQAAIEDKESEGFANKISVSMDRLETGCIDECPTSYCAEV